jgi:hypothetical protein
MLAFIYKQNHHPLHLLNSCEFKIKKKKKKKTFDFQANWQGFHGKGT